MTLRERFANLLAVPSRHYEPIFAARVREAFATFRPTVVALELPEYLTDEIGWAITCWPGPVCSMSNGAFVPFVPGDSILEAYRLAQRDGVSVKLIDLQMDGPILRPDFASPGPECAPRVGPLFLETFEALAAAAGPPAEDDLEREAFMAGRLAQLMAEHERVLWVGGLGHWRRLRDRLAAGACALAGPARRRPRIVRFRLTPSALMESTARLPYLVGRYAGDPEHYDEPEAIRALALDALEEREDLDVALVIEGQSRLAEQLLLPEAKSSADIIRTLLYARNLAATRAIGDRPSLRDLLTAASAVIGNRYAGRLYIAAMQEQSSEVSRTLTPLSYEAKKGRLGYRARGRRLEATPFREVPRVDQSRMIRIEEVARRSRDAPYDDLPSAMKGDKLGWACYPPDEEAYEAFVRYVLRLATVADAKDEKSAAFVAGMRDGVDARETLRHWKDETIFVRERPPLRLQVTNALIDFSNETESTALLQGGEIDAGWADPSCSYVGSASLHFRSDKLQEKPCHLLMMWRELSLVTIDCPTSFKQDESRSFYSKVVTRLIHLPHDRRNLYTWLDVMFGFCARKPFGYFSPYKPSQRIEQIAAKHRVRIVHVPLRRIPAPLLERNRSFRFFNLTRKQWDALVKGVAEGRGAWAVG